MKYAIIGPLHNLSRDLSSGKISLLQAIITAIIIVAVFIAGNYIVKYIYSLFGKKYPTEEEQKKEIEEMKTKKFKDLTLYWKVDFGLTWAFKIIMGLIIISFLTLFIYNLVNSY